MRQGEKSEVGPWLVVSPSYSEIFRPLLSLDYQIDLIDLIDKVSTIPITRFSGIEFHFFSSC